MNERFHPPTFKPASFLDRLLAILIDLFIIGIGQSILKSLLPSAMSIFVSIASLFYFLIFQTKYGATPGKKIMGLRVLNFNSADYPSPGSVLLRETIGRAISALPLFGGYLMALFKKDAQALHDIIAGTRVIQEKEKATSVWRTLGTGAAAFSAFIGITVYVALFTSIPLQQAAKKMELSGNVKISGISGSLARGIRIATLEFSDEKSSGVFKDLRFEYQLAKLFADNKFVITQIKVGGGQIELKPAAIASMRGSKNREAKERSQSEVEPLTSNSKRAKRRPLEAIEIKLVDIGNIEVTYGSGKSLKLNRFWIQNFQFSKNTGAQMDQMGIEAPSLAARSGHISFDKNGDMKMSHSLSIQIKPAMSLALAREITAQVYANRIGGKFTDVNIAAFENKVRLTRKDGTYNLNIRNFNPADYYTAKSPLKNINLSLAGESLIGPDFNGSFQLGSRSVNVENSQVKFMVKDREFSAQLNPVLMSMNVLDGKFALTLATDAPSADRKQDLALVMFDKDLSQLSAEENLEISQAELIQIRPPMANLKSLSQFMNQTPIRVPAATKAGSESNFLADQVSTELLTAPTICQPQELTFMIPAETMASGASSNLGPGTCTGRVVFTGMVGSTRRTCQDYHCATLRYGDGSEKLRRCDVFAKCEGGKAIATGFTW